MPPAHSDFAGAFIASLLTVEASPDGHIRLCNFIRRILQRSELSYSALLLAVLYLHRLQAVRRRWPQEVEWLVPGDHSGCAEFLTAVMLADKYLYDTAFANEFWANNNGRYRLHELNAFEWRFLDWIDYDLYVSAVSFDDFIAFLEVTLALRQAAARGHHASLTYADLTAMSVPLPPQYAAELRLTLPPPAALRLAAQALLGSAAVYSSILVCLVVLAAFAAGPSALLSLAQGAGVPAASAWFTPGTGAPMQPMAPAPPGEALLIHAKAGPAPSRACAQTEQPLAVCAPGPPPEACAG